MILSAVRRWSLARRLSLFITLAMSVLIIMIVFIIFSQMVRQIQHKDTREMTHILQTQRQALSNVHDGRRLKIWQQRWLDNFDPDKRVFLRVYRSDGTLYAVSPQMPDVRGHFPAPGEPFRYQHGYDRLNERKARLLLASESIPLSNGETWQIQVVLNASQEREMIELVMHILRNVGIVAVIACALLSWLLVRTGLKPLRTLSQRMQAVHVEQLDTRIGNQPWPAELKELADSFDGMLERLEHSFAELSRFSSDIAHEFRAPVNNIIAAASVMQSRPRSAEEYQDTLEKIMEEGERLSRMITSMLFLARADNAREVIHPETLSAHKLFEQVAEFFSLFAEEKGVTLTIAGDQTLQADALLLGRALSNLVDNALRYTPEGGVITLEARAQGSNILLSVSDSGAGIDAAHLAHIFERFYRADSARSDRESSGLGLALVKSIAEMHDGRVKAESEPGKGSCFTLILPARISRNDAKLSE